MKIEGSVAVVTGANRGLGAAFTEALLDRGAAKVYAAVRRPETITDARLTPVKLDLTDPASIAEAASVAADTDLLINNAGISTHTSILGDVAGLREEIEVNYLGPVAVSQAFAPVLAANGGGALVNVLSVLSWLTLPVTAGYCAAKSAMWSATNALRLTLAERGTQVVGVHVGYIDTDMAAVVTAPKMAPRAVVAAIFDGIEAGEHEVLVDDISREVRAGLAGPLSHLYPSLMAPA
jgi:NAD(P)-dependent dehydrogenase (short-subunit alcohol dehydrogenase family)